IIVDKTGTVTEGKPKVIDVVAAPAFDATELLRIAASVEQASEHPLANAIVTEAKDRSLTLSKVTGFDSPAGKGVIGVVDGHDVTIGHAPFLRERGISAE